MSVSRNRARMRVLLEALKLHVYGGGTFGAFWSLTDPDVTRVAKRPMIVQSSQLRRARFRGESES